MNDVDRDVLRQIWAGQVPVVFTLATEDVDSLTPPDSVHLLLPRISYFPLVTDKVKKQFTSHIDASLADNPVWLSYEDKSLPWHLPIGHSFDLLVSSRVAKDERCLSIELLPWRLVVHFSHFPAPDLVLPYQSISCLQTAFISAIKEADHLKHSSRIISAMGRDDHDQLWQGLASDKYETFWSVNERLIASTISMKHIPVRLYLAGPCPSHPLGQRLISPSDMSTVGDLLDSESMIVITHGIVVPKSATLVWLSSHLSYADNFLHLIICRSENQNTS